MALAVPCGSLPKKTLVVAAQIVATCALACALTQAPIALAQRGQAGQQGAHVAGGHSGAGAHPGGGQVSAPHVSLPPAPAVPIPHTPVVGQKVGFGQHVGLGHHAGFGPRPIFVRVPIFHRPLFFRLQRNFYPYWGVNCGPAWVWGFGCGNWRPPEYVAQNYVTIYESPVYVYYEGDHQLVEIFLKDGMAYSVTDYWFVNDQVHFTTLGEDGTKSVEEVIGLDELDLKKTINVNTRRGFRVVRRDEPLEPYLRDHPDANAPLLEPPSKN